MFGYVRPLQPELKLVEHDLYQSVYCGLCRQLGHAFGPFARFTLSYDFVFLAMLAMGMTEAPPALAPRRCFVNPLKKKMCCRPCQALEMAGDVAMILLYYKVKDDLQDEHLWRRGGAWIFLLFVAAARRKAAIRQPEVDGVVAQTMAAQSALEAAGCDDLDRACEPTANALSAIFSGMADSEDNRRALARLGYLMGRYIYMADALDDWEKDIQNGCYNPFVARFKPDIGDTKSIEAMYRQGVQPLYGTIAEMGRTVDLLSFQRMGGIIGNVVHLGLKNTVDTIIHVKLGKELGQ